MQGPPPHYVPDHLTATAGDLVFFLNNVSHGTHTLAIGPPSALQGPVLNIRSFLTVSDSVVPGRSAAFSVHGLHAGSYAIWCTIDGHAEEGMVGTLTVK